MLAVVVAFLAVVRVTTVIAYTGTDKYVTDVVTIVAVAVVAVPLSSSCSCHSMLIIQLLLHYQIFAPVAVSAVTAACVCN